MKKVLITGASSGIGREIVHSLLSQGIQVVGIARDHEKLGHVCENYTPVTIDLAETRSLEQQLKALFKQHDDIDALILSAGYGQFAQIEQFSFSQMQNLMNVNFLSQALLVKLALSMLKQRSGTKIIVIGSEAALAGAKKGSMYCASKFALRGFCQSIARECSTRDVAVTLIHPGAVATPFFDNLDFSHGDAPENAIQPEQLIPHVLAILNTDNNCVVEEISIKPMKQVVQKKA